MYDIKYHELVVKKDIAKLTLNWKNRIKEAIEEKLMSSPEVFGKPLRRSLKNYRKLRVGNYRVIFKIKNKTVLIFAIQHRSVVYQNMEKNRREDKF